MRHLLLLLFLALSAPADPALKRYLYISTPDAAQPVPDAPKGILVFDIDDGHRFVRKIDIPFKEGLRGFCGNAKRHAVYYSSTAGRLGAFDIESEKLLWEKRYNTGCDRACITPDGSKLYVPTGWWQLGKTNGFLVVNPENGDILNRLTAGGGAHNSIASLDGKFAYLGTQTNFWVFNTSDDSLAKQIPNV